MFAICAWFAAAPNPPIIPPATPVPGIMLLVPGSFGFRSVSSFLERDVLSGVESAFDMAQIAGALVGGLLFANALLRPRRSL